MKKNIVQDVVPRGKKTIRDIPLAFARREASENRVVPASTHVHASHDSERLPRDGAVESFLDQEGNSSGLLSKLIMWGIGALSVTVLVVVVGNLFVGAELTLTPKTENLTVNLALTAKPAATAGSLLYEPFSLVREKEAAVPADGEKSVELQASGKIIIYNKYSAVPQRLVKSARFEAPDGLIYKITSSVTIPGRHSEGGAVIPGSIEAAVLAESPGAEYNIGLTDFTVPGFKSSPERFSAFFARSKTPMAGGKIGTIKTVSPEKMLEAKARLEEDMKGALVAEATTHLADGSVFYDGAYVLNFEVMPQPMDSLATGVTLRERAKFTAFFFTRDDVAKAIAEKTIENFDGAPVTLLSGDKLALDLKNKTSYSATSIGPVELTLKGTATLVWKIDQEKLKKELAGKNKNALGAVVSRYPAIVKADVVVRPFWRSGFPSEASKIQIQIL